MNSKAILALAIFAAFASTGARADEGGQASSVNVNFESSRTRAEVRAEAIQAAGTRYPEPQTWRTAQQPESTLDAREVRAQAAEAVRLGQISYGEAGSI